jgi:hypothetical protein
MLFLKYALWSDRAAHLLSLEAVDKRSLSLFVETPSESVDTGTDLGCAVAL